jgi:ABC-type Na+ transport system ATPase subunit NatA
MDEQLQAWAAEHSTVLRILAGIVNPSSGQVRVNGHGLSTEAGKQAVKSMLGYLPQELEMYPDLTSITAFSRTWSFLLHVAFCCLRTKYGSRFSGVGK